MKDKLRKYIELRPVAVEGEPDAHNVILKVTNQQFCLGPLAAETKEDAEWTADMLCIALEKIVREITQES